MNKLGQFNFVWLFAIIVGGAILFLAIYGAMQAGDTARFQSDTEVAKSIAIITDPLQVGFGESSFGRISFNDETRINNICLGSGFGKNDISVSTRSNVGEEWNLAGGATSIHNKYIFSSEQNSGEDYYVFSKGFDFPYEVADLIFLTAEDYCFINAPEEVVDEVLGLGIPNIEFDYPTGMPLGSELSNCSVADAVKVCFGNGDGCDMMVYGSCQSNCDSVFDAGVVSKGSGGDLKYVGSLMYGAIFSDKAVYECNVERLMYRAGKIAEEFASKGDLMDSRGCDTNIKSDLIVWSGMLFNSTADNLMSMRMTSDNLGKKNKRELCGMWR
ncbi:hypothetical protein HN935_01830 [archaeon]|jgi:hypothetical protein|nr:hypothetical protein [archaeon]